MTATLHRSLFAVVLKFLVIGTRRWHQWIDSPREYFEDDHGGIQQWGM